MVRTDADRERWNARYEDAPAMVGRPSRWLVEQEALLTPRPGDRALDAACGTGRHALHLAQRGYTVDALDVSDVAIAALAGTAREHGVPVLARRADVLTNGAIPPDTYAAVAVFFFLQRTLWPVLSLALAPGGLLIYETFTRRQLECGWGPSDERFLLAPGELETAFGELDILRYEEGARADGDAHTARLVARRPAQRDAG